MALPEVRDFVRLHYAGKIYWLLLPIHYGAIAQLGERIVRNDEVVGSLPTRSTNPSYLASDDVPDVEV